MAGSWLFASGNSPATNSFPGSMTCTTDADLHVRKSVLVLEGHGWHYRQPRLWLTGTVVTPPTNVKSQYQCLGWKYGSRLVKRRTLVEVQNNFNDDSQRVNSAAPDTPCIAHGGATKSSFSASAWVDGWMLEELWDFQQQDAACREALHWVADGVKPDKELNYAYFHEVKMLCGIFKLSTVQDGLLYRKWQLPGMYPELVTQLYVLLTMHHQVMHHLHGSTWPAIVG